MGDGGQDEAHADRDGQETREEQPAPHDVLLLLDEKADPLRPGNGCLKLAGEGLGGAEPRPGAARRGALVPGAGELLLVEGEQVRLQFLVDFGPAGAADGDRREGPGEEVRRSSGRWSLCRGPQDAAQDADELLPVGPARVERTLSLGGQAVDAAAGAAAAVVAGLPVGLDLAGGLEAVEGGVEGALLEAEQAAAGLVEAAEDLEAVRSPRSRVERTIASRWPRSLSPLISCMP